MSNHIISYLTWLGAVLCCVGFVVGALMYGLYLCIIHRESLKQITDYLFSFRRRLSVPLLILTPPHMYVWLHRGMRHVLTYCMYGVPAWGLCRRHFEMPPPPPLVACWCVHGGPKIKNLWKLKSSIDLRVTWQTWHVSVSDVRVCPEERLSWRLEVSVPACTYLLVLVPHILTLALSASLFFSSANRSVCVDVIIFKGNYIIEVYIKYRVLKSY